MRMTASPYEELDLELEALSEEDKKLLRDLRAALRRARKAGRSGLPVSRTKGGRVRRARPSPRARRELKALSEAMERLAELDRKKRHGAKSHERGALRGKASAEAKHLRMKDIHGLPRRHDPADLVAPSQYAPGGMPHSMMVNTPWYDVADASIMDEGLPLLDDEGDLAPDPNTRSHLSEFVAWAGEVATDVGSGIGKFNDKIVTALWDAAGDLRQLDADAAAGLKRNLDSIDHPHELITLPLAGVAGFLGSAGDVINAIDSIPNDEHGIAAPLYAIGQNVQDAIDQRLYQPEPGSEAHERRQAQANRKAEAFIEQHGETKAARWTGWVSRSAPELPEMARDMLTGRNMYDRRRFYEAVKRKLRERAAEEGLKGRLSHGVNQGLGELGADAWALLLPGGATISEGGNWFLGKSTLQDVALAGATDLALYGLGKVVPPAMRKLVAKTGKNAWNKGLRGVTKALKQTDDVLGWVGRNTSGAKSSQVVDKMKRSLSVAREYASREAVARTSHRVVETVAGVAEKGTRIAIEGGGPLAVNVAREVVRTSEAAQGRYGPLSPPLPEGHLYLQPLTDGGLSHFSMSRK